MSGIVKSLKSRLMSSREVDKEVWNLVSPERGSLSKLKRVSIRNRTWFIALSWEQRRLIDAVIMTVDKIRSFLVLKILAPLVRNLLIALGGDIEKGAFVLMGNGAYKLMKNVADKIVWFAQKWGNRYAHKWLDDDFIRYLIVMNLPQNRSLLAFQ